MDIGPRVVVGVAAKEPEVVDVAVAEARQRGAHLVVVHATGLPANLQNLVAATARDDEAQTAGEKVLDAARELVERHRADDLPVRYVLSGREPVEALTEESREADVLVLGTDSIRWFKRLVGGAVTERMVRHATIPVLVVPQVTHPGSTGVAVAFEGEATAQGPLRFAFEEARARSAPLTVVHAMPPDVRPRESDAVRALIARALAGWRREYPTVPVGTLFVDGRAEDPSLVPTGSAELLVVERPRSATVATALSRPTAAALMARAETVVALVPADYAGPR